MTKKPRKTRLWNLDDSLFQAGPRAGFLERHVVHRARSFAKYSLYAFAFAYPTVLVTLGLMFGGLVFWGSLAGSVLVIWIVLKQTGYARNFAGWDWGYSKFVGLFGAFGMMLGLILGLINIGLRVFPLMAAGLVTVLVLGIWRISRR